MLILGMLRVNSIIVFFSLVLIGCTVVKKKEDRKITVSFSNTGRKTPFSSCEKTKTSELVLFVDSAKTFEMAIDPDWNYTYSYSEGEMFLHCYILKRDSSIKFTVLVDSDFYEEKKGRLLSDIQPEDGVGFYNLDSDTCQWKSSVVTEETAGQVKYIFECRFQYYCKVNRRLYWIFVTQEKEIKTELNLNAACEFQESIESFRSLK